jgi:hypothetical protein
VFNHSDYRLVSRRVLDALSRYQERDMFIRGILPMVGFKSAVVTYDRRERNAGTTKYNYVKLLALALNGATSLTLRPLRFICVLGALMLAVSLIIAVAALAALFSPFGRLTMSARGLAFSVWFVGGLVTLAIGVVGEYAGRAFMEAKRRPRYHIETSRNIEGDSEELE